MLGSRRALQAVLLVVVYIAVSEIGGAVEGQVAPVVVDVRVDWTDHSETQSVASGFFHLARPGCDFDDLAWRLDADRAPRVPIEFLEGTKEREGGIQEFGPWLVQLSPSQRTRSRAVVFHQCPYRPWLTETVFYVGPTPEGP